MSPAAPKPRLASTLFLLTVSVAMASCGDSSSTAPPTVQSVTVSAPASSLELGATMQLQAVVLPSDAPQGVSWSTSASGVASVSPTGLVTALAAGPVTIRAASTDDPTRAGSVQLTVVGCGALLPAMVSNGASLPANTCYQASSPLIVSGGTLTIGAGVRIEFGPNAYLSISSGGRLRAIGTTADPIVLTGADPQQRWRGVRFAGSASAENALHWVRIENGGSSGWSGAAHSTSALLLESGSLVDIRNSTFTGSGGQGFTAYGGTTVTFEGNTLSNNAVAAWVHPDAAGFIGGNTTFQSNTANVVRVAFGNTDAVESARTWRALTVPYEVQTRMFVDAPLTLEAGADLTFDAGVAMIVRNGGSIRAMGTAAAPIRMRGSESLPGAWQGVQITTASADNVFERVVFEHGGGGAWSGAPDARSTVQLSGNSKAVFRNSTFRGSSHYGLWVPAEGDIQGFEGNTFEGNARTMIVHPNRAGAIAASNTFTGNADNRVRVSFGNTDAVTTAQTWNDFGAPFLVTVRTFVRAPLTIAAGTEIEFAQNASLIVAQEGSLRASGSAASPIALRGGEDLVGYWHGIEYGSVSANNVLEHVTLSNGGSQAWFGGANSTATLHVTGVGRAALANVAFRRTGGFAIVVSNGGAVTCSGVDHGGFQYFSFATNSASSSCP